MLFRYSALTYNAHRIHYDLPYARDEEGYRGLVVHGPLIATLLLDVGLPLAEGRAARHFAFRAQSPAFAGEPLLLHARAEDQAIAMWSTDAAGRVGMTARLDLSAHSTGRTPR
jgi:3-methylfumaryl-CoA hydratase